MHPLYYRGCWHRVSRCLFLKYRQNFFLEKRGLQPTGFHPSRGIAPSGFRPLRKIPQCCLPEESGPCLSPSVAGRPLKPATDRRLGEPLPPQQANQTRALPKVDRSFHLSAYRVLATVSSCYPLPKGRFSRVTHPSATRAKSPRTTCMY